MKSFRLDRESVSDFIESWPVLVASVALCVWLGSVGWSNATWRILLVMYAGAYFGYIGRGRLSENLRERYPNARWTGLLSIGLSVMTLGVLARMALPAAQGGLLDIAWLSLSFLCILTFVVMNRRDPDVWR